MSLHVERGPMVVEDVRALPPEPLVVAEGSTMPASLVPVDRALWLLPTPELQRQRLEERGLPPAARALYELLYLRPTRPEPVGPPETGLEEPRPGDAALS
mgnify:CR=1 FL=1